MPCRLLRVADLSEDRTSYLCTDLCSCSQDDGKCENQPGECDDDDDDSDIEDQEDDDDALN